MNLTDAASAPREITVTRYVCTYCSRGHAKRAAATAHIARCWANPDNRGCKSCAFHIPAGGQRGGCQPGEDCSCNVIDEECEQGIDISTGLRTGCPKWAPAGDGPL